MTGRFILPNPHIEERQGFFVVRPDTGVGSARPPALQFWQEGAIVRVGWRRRSENLLPPGSVFAGPPYEEPPEPSG